VRLLFGLLSFAATLAFSPVAAAAAPTPTPARPKPNFGPLRFLIGGEWDCAVKNSRYGSPAHIQMEYGMSADDYWLVGAIYHPRAAWYPHVFRTYFRYTFDSSISKWVEIQFDEDGGYSVSTSKGPKGSTWAWHDLGRSRS
jgi:hypothetical protein